MSFGNVVGVCRVAGWPACARPRHGKVGDDRDGRDHAAAPNVAARASEDPNLGAQPVANGTAVRLSADRSGKIDALVPSEVRYQTAPLLFSDQA